MSIYWAYLICVKAFDANAQFNAQYNQGIPNQQYNAGNNPNFGGYNDGFQGNNRQNIAMQNQPGGMGMGPGGGMLQQPGGYI